MKSMSEAIFDVSGKNWIDFAKDQKAFFVKNTKRGDVPPTVIAERDGEVFAVVVGSEVDRNLALKASSILRRGGADALILILDAHVRRVDSENGDEFLKNYKHGDMQRACDEEGACELGIISDCLVCQRIDTEGNITLKILTYSYHGEGTEFKWTPGDKDEYPEGTTFDGYIVENLQKIMKEPTFADDKLLMKKARDAGITDVDKIFYYTARSVFHLLNMDGYYLFDLLSCRYPKWCKAEEKAEEIIKMLVDKEVLPKVALVALARIIPDHIGKPSFNVEFAKVLVKYKDKFAKEHAEIPDHAESFANFVHQEAFAFKEPTPPQPKRKLPFKVKVWNGDQSEFLGEGTYVGEVTVYFIQTENGISSGSNAEQRPEGVPEDQIIEAPNNPKIVLDSGRTVYGCQVWWEPVDGESAAPKTESKWPGPKNHKCHDESCGCEE